ncbi:membrane AbrB-like protein [Geodermatophilus bullaregiensis]|uniref:AbrB family transcriptional regulator n=1 Tax=Geodermatophilus bullaregiensis TaxID=1564160 RepID=UPI0019575595|nr:AbrB family transcriptional regulator [Geodermatophilus bullaregiensis]MBM7807132.1 membrane AbrB-like protein [Geodermatophilus bullaregiensis]
MARAPLRRLADAALVVAGAALASWLLDRAGVPSAALFGGLLAGLVRGLAGRTPLAVPRTGTAAAQAVVGVSIGALVDLDTLAALGEDWLPVLLVTVATLLLTVAAGSLLRLQPGITPVTGAFAMIAGGASGITAMARDLGADDRMVAVLQYLRVLLVVVLMPVVATAVYGAEPGSGSAAPAAGGAGWAADLLFTAGCALAGSALARLVRLPVPALLGPMLAAAVLDLGGLSGGAAVPGLVETAAFLLIGLQVGVSFTRDSLRTIGGALPLALAIVLGLIAACAGLGEVLSAATGVSRLDAYLATTPGGLYAVLATATGTGADATFVLAVQVLRLFVMLLGAPLLARYLARRPG